MADPATGRPDAHEEATTESTSEDFRQHAHQVRVDAADLGHDLAAMGEEARARMREQLERRPYGTLAAAAGVGYLLGGGLPSGVTKFLMGVGARAATGLLAAKLVSTLGDEHGPDL